jgi:hypothetical protein
LKTPEKVGATPDWSLMKVVVIFKEHSDDNLHSMSLGEIGSIEKAMSHMSLKVSSYLNNFDYSQHDLHFCPFKHWSIEKLDPYAAYLLDPDIELDSFPSNCHVINQDIYQLCLSCHDDLPPRIFYLKSLFNDFQSYLLHVYDECLASKSTFFNMDLPLSVSPLELSSDQLLGFSFSIFKKYQKELDGLNVKDEVLKNFLLLVKSLYLQNNYHNFYHAVDVLQCSHFILCDSSLRSSLRDVEVLAVLIAALCHDIGHVGVSNSFLNRFDCDLSLLYNGSSPLENYHSFVTNFILDKLCTCDFRSNWDRTLKREFRSLLVGSILATDMVHHNRYLSLFRSKELFESDRHLLLGMILKAADLSNVVRPFESSEKWSHCLKLEFYLQGDLERKMGYCPEMKHMDREVDVFCDSQVFFLESYALPLFQILCSYYPSLTYMLDNIVINIGRWRGKK